MVQSILFLSGSVMTTAFDMIHEHRDDMPKIFRNPSLAPFVALMTLRCSLMELEILEATPLRESRIRLCLAAVVSTSRPHTALRRVLKMLSFCGPWPYVLASDALPLSLILALGLQCP